MEYSLDSPFGPLILGFSGGQLTSLRLAGQDSAPPYRAGGAGAGAEMVAEWLRAYFAGENPEPGAIAFKAKGTAFQERVWEALLGIPYGYCVTYGFVAGLLSRGKRPGRLLARAVGNALARNPIWIIVPCHRVIRANGDLGNYAGGVDMKRALLRLEGAALREFEE